jgi:hypothetical protein
MTAKRLGWSPAVAQALTFGAVSLMIRPKKRYCCFVTRAKTVKLVDPVYAPVYTAPAPIGGVLTHNW